MRLFILVLATLPFALTTNVAQAERAAPESSSQAQTPQVTLDVHIEGRRGSLDEATIRRWVGSMVRMAGDYCGHFPVDALRVEVRLRSGRRVVFGQHFTGRRVVIHVGRNTSEDALRRDHVLLHELLHTALPSLDRRHRWMREGLSTYLETMVRAQNGIITEDDVWNRWTDSMENGMPRAGDRGLDRTPTWGRVYWGGALFWMVVDVELRRATQGRHTVRSLVAGIVARGGVARRRWSMQRLLRVADQVSGTQVVSQAYRRMALRPSAPNLDSFFARLGVRRSGDRVQFFEGPESRLRASMMRR
ncbi:MAG: hypothetical protein ACI9KE_001871 [Polyangiales bacterium]